jgi:drug/metabolite transporter (DMT)-like permease
MTILTAAVGRGEAYALGCAVSWALSLIVFRRCGDGVRPFTLNFFKNGLAAMCFLPVVLLLYRDTLAALHGFEWGLLILSGFLGVCLADWLFFRGLNLLGAGGIAIVECFYVPIMVVLSMLILGERITSWQGVGVLLVVAGVALAEYAPRTEPITRRRRFVGIAYGLAGVLLMGLAIVPVKPILERYAVLPILEIRLLFGFLAAIPLLPLVERPPAGQRRFHRGLPYGWMVLGTTLGTLIAMTFWIAGFKYTSTSTAAVINQTNVFFVILFAAIFLRERPTPRKLAGATLGFLGVVLVALAAP